MPRRSIRAGALVAMAAAAAMPRLREKLGVPRFAALTAVSLGPPSVAIVLRRGRRRSYAVFLAQMWAYLRAFELTYARPERLRRRLRVDYLIRADRMLGMGRPPGVRLQAWRARSGRAETLDRVFGSVYFAWALERHAALLTILGRDPEAFPRAAVLVAAAFDVGWVIYSALPSAPPWWAAKHGHIDGLHRVTVEASRSLPLVPAENEEDSDQGNPWASMPSTHTASAAMVALVLAELDPRLGIAAALYACALGFSLVYLGEHYAVDVLAGLALALAIRAAEPPARPVARRIASALESLGSSAPARS